jgi:hypothetical protein
MERTVKQIVTWMVLKYYEMVRSAGRQRVLTALCNVWNCGVCGLEHVMRTRLAASSGEGWPFRTLVFIFCFLLAFNLFVCVPPDAFSLQLCASKVDV